MFTLNHGDLSVRAACIERKILICKVAHIFQSKYGDIWFILAVKNFEEASYDDICLFSFVKSD